MKSMIELAAKVAQSGNPDRNFRLGCVAQRKDGAIVFSTNEKTQKPNPCAHAEARVLRKAGYGATLWVARITSNGSLTMAKPCPKCQAKIRSYGVKKVIYSIAPGEFGTWYPGKTKTPDQDFIIERGACSVTWKKREL